MDRRYDNRGGYDQRGRQEYRGPPPPFRERSRDSRDFRGGGRGRGRFGGGGRGYTPRRLYDEDYQVQTNYYKINVQPSVQQQGAAEYFEYRATIYAARKIKKGPDGEPLPLPRIVFREERDKNKECVPGTRKEISIEKGATELTEKILLALQRKLSLDDPPKQIATDGGSTVFSPNRLFSESDSPNQKYGTATDGSSQQDEPQRGRPSQSFDVAVKKDGREDDSFADKLQDIYFIVTLQEIGSVKFRVIRGSPWPIDDTQVEKLSLCMNLILKNTMLTNGCRQFEKSSQTCYFPHEAQQNELRGPNLFPKRQYPTIAPRVGLNESSRACGSQAMFAARSLKLRWFNLEVEQLDSFRASKRIPILDVEKRTIAGVQIPSLQAPIPLNERQHIKEALQKLVFHVIFRSNPSEEQMKVYRVALTEEQIETRRDIVRAYQWLFRSDQKDPIVWAANDPTQYSFDRGGTATTVDEYMKERYGVTLRFPTMPLVNTKYGYYPVEFLFQALEIQKGADKDPQKMIVLKYHDEYSGEAKITHTKKGVQMLGNLGVEHAFGLDISKEPETVRAKKLAEPSLMFANRSSVEVRNGSWNIQGKEFYKPADFTSFCVVDFAGDRKHELVLGVLKACERHGLQNDQYKNDYQTVTEEVTCSVRLDRNRGMVNQVQDGVTRAIQMAKDFFLKDCKSFFHKRHIMFQTLVPDPRKGGMTKALVYPKATNREIELGIIYPEEVMWASNTISVGGGDPEDARMFISVTDQTGSRHSVDPFHFRWNEVSNDRDAPKWEALIGNSWRRVSFESYEWKLRDGNSVTDARAIVNCVEYDGTGQIDCPSLIFAILPEKENDLYSLVKLCTNFYCGIQSQCLVWKTYKRQRSPDQYFSNIALKLNAKLSNSLNNAQAWQIDNYRGRTGMPWVSEAETMIVGIAMSRGSGRDSRTVVTATATVPSDSGSCMTNGFAVRVQSEPAVVEPSVMQSLMKTLTIHFCEHRNAFPQRVLVFRDGSSQGAFQKLERDEIPAMRRALSEAWNEVQKDAPSSELYEEPKLSFVLCVNDHGVEIVPSNGNGVRQGRTGPENVPSGTCVSDVIMPFSGMKLETSGDSSDFFLTAQGGLKGTSKAVQYRVLLNENKATLTPEVLRSLVFGLSFAYGTATKATRRLSVAQYAKRMAEQFLSYLPYIDDRSARKHTVQNMPVLVSSTETDEVFRNDEHKNPELLPGFSARSDGEEWSVALRPHLAA